MLPSSGSISVKVSVMFCLTIRPTFDRLASQGSMISGSSDSTMVMFLSCACALPTVNAIDIAASDTARQKPRVASAT